MLQRRWMRCSIWLAGAAPAISIREPGSSRSYRLVSVCLVGDGDRSQLPLITTLLKVKGAPHARMLTPPHSVGWL